jgi:hypothetical protein
MIRVNQPGASLILFPNHIELPSSPTITLQRIVSILSDIEWAYITGQDHHIVPNVVSFPVEFTYP